MTNHHRAVLLAQTVLIRDEMPVHCDAAKTLDRLMQFDADKVPSGDLTDWVTAFLYRAQTQLQQEEAEDGSDETDGATGFPAV